MADIRTIKIAMAIQKIVFNVDNETLKKINPYIKELESLIVEMINELENKKEGAVG